MRRLLTPMLFVAAAAAAQDLDAIFFEVEPGVVVRLSDLPARDDHDATPLHRVARAVGDPALVRAMIARGADPDAMDVEGRTPLRAAVEADAPLAVVDALIDAGADVSLRDVEGLTALHVARSAEVASALLDAGADPCATDAGGEPALSVALLEAAREAAPATYGRLTEAFLSCL